MKNSFAIILNVLSVLKLFQLSNGDFFFVACLQNLKVRMTKLGQGVEVKSHYPMEFGVDFPSLCRRPLEFSMVFVFFLFIFILKVRKVYFADPDKLSPFNNQEPPPYTIQPSPNCTFS